jgi:hypothetical protein
MNTGNVELERLVLKYGLVDEVSLARLKMRSISSGKELKELILQEGLVTEDALLYAISTELNLPFVTLDPKSIDHSLVKRIPQEVLEGYKFLPIIEVDGEVRVAVADPTDTELMRLLEDTYPDKQVSICVAIASNILDTIDAIFSEEDKPSGIASSAIAMFYTTLTEAVKNRASAMYVEPIDDKMRIRVRQKGRLLVKGIHPGEFIRPILEKVKQTLNIGDPGSGSIKTVIAGRQVYITARMLGTDDTPGAILLFHYSGRSISLSRLPMDETSLIRLQKGLHSRSGCILVTGPNMEFWADMVRTMLRELNPEKRKVVALVDEEIPLEGVERYIYITTEETNKGMKSLLGAGIDAVYIQNIHRSGFDIELMFRLSDETLLIASLPAKNAKDAIRIIKRMTDGIEINEKILLIVEILKEPVACIYCSERGWQVGRGCRRCGYSGVKDYIEKINVITFGEGG